MTSANASLPDSELGWATGANCIGPDNLVAQEDLLGMELRFGNRPLPASCFPCATFDRSHTCVALTPRKRGTFLVVPVSKYTTVYEFSFPYCIVCRPRKYTLIEYQA